jgi:hypothetical protein
MTDEARHYMGVGQGFKSHGAVTHAAKEYAQGEISTNTIEGFYSIFKRGMQGIYQHCAEKHLQALQPSKACWLPPQHTASGVNVGLMADPPAQTRANDLMQPAALTRFIREQKIRE